MCHPFFAGVTEGIKIINHCTDQVSDVNNVKAAGC